VDSARGVAVRPAMRNRVRRLSGWVSRMLEQEFGMYVVIACAALLVAGVIAVIRAIA
jgi:hypothetical protein